MRQVAHGNAGGRLAGGVEAHGLVVQPAGLRVEVIVGQDGVGANDGAQAGHGMPQHGRAVGHVIQVV